MNELGFSFFGQSLQAASSGALWWPEECLLCVSDLHLGKSNRIARRGGVMLPPYETTETLQNLADDVTRLNPATVVCLGDSFDDLDAAGSLSEANRARLAGLQAGREWVWIEGNHDPGPVDLGGSHVNSLARRGLTFRHIWSGEPGEVSGHYHPKYAVPGVGGAKPCFLFDKSSLILPAYGTYTGGLHATDPALARCFSGPVMAIRTGRKPVAVPVLQGRAQGLRPF